MTTKEITNLLLANTGKRLRATFRDGVIQSVLIGSVDSEGFVHSGPDGSAPEGFWTRLEDVRLLEPETPN